MEVLKLHLLGAGGVFLLNINLAKFNWIDKNNNI